MAHEGKKTTLEWLQAADPVSESPANRLRAVVAEFARTQAAYHGRSKVVEYELTALSPDHYRAILGLRRKLTRHMREIVEAGAAEGSFAVPDAEGVTLAIVSLCVDVCRWFPAGRYADPETVAKLHSELALRLVNATTEQDRPDDATATRAALGRRQSLQRHRRTGALGGLRRPDGGSAHRHGARIGWLTPELGQDRWTAGRAPPSDRHRLARFRVLTCCGQKDQHRSQHEGTRPLHQRNPRQPSHFDGQLDGRCRHDPEAGRQPAGGRRGSAGRSGAATPRGGSRSPSRRT